MDEIKEIAKHIIALYSTDTDYAGVRKIVQEYYAEEAVYQNAAFSVTGRENIIAHVIWTKSIFDSSAIEVKSVGYDSDSDSLNIQMVQTYTRHILKIPISFTVHNFVTCSLSKNKSMVSHQTDHIDIATLIENVPIINRLYDVGRSIAGSVTSNIFKTAHALASSRLLTRT